jgi:hypothetical protein
VPFADGSRGICKPSECARRVQRCERMAVWRLLRSNPTTRVQAAGAKPYTQASSGELEAS